MCHPLHGQRWREMSLENRSALGNAVRLVLLLSAIAPGLLPMVVAKCEGGCPLPIQTVVQDNYVILKTLAWMGGQPFQFCYHDHVSADGG